MYGFSTETFGASIDSEFKSLALKRKGVGDANLREITCLIDEVVVIRASSACLIDCSFVTRNSNLITYKIQCIPAGDFSTDNISDMYIPINSSPGIEFQIEYFVFGAPNPDNSEYGLNIYNAQGEVVFSSNNRYLFPVSTTYVTPEGKSVCFPEDIDSREKLGVILNASSAFWSPAPQRANGLRVSQTMIAFEPFKGGRRKIGLYITATPHEGGGETTILTGNLSSMIVDLRGL